MRVGILVGLVLGGAGLIYGFRLLTAGLQEAGGERWLSALRGAAARPWRGVLAGAAATAMVQSSSVTTIVLVGCVDAGVLTLRQAIPVLMGANIGTTVTAHLLASAPAGAASTWPGLALGAAALAAWTAAAAARRQTWCARARVLAGAALLVLALESLGLALAPLGRTPLFTAAMERLSQSPLLGVLAGAILTSLVMSSAVTIGLLQRLASQGLIPLAGALPVLFGDNIGTCTDTLLASLAGGRQARAAALAHLIFNIAGTLALLPALYWLPGFLVALTPDPERQIAVAHTLFNVSTTLLLLPAAGSLAAVAARLAGVDRNAHPRRPFSNRTPTGRGNFKLN